MHPMFVKLFLEAGADDLLADEEDKQRTANRARRHRSRMATRLTNRDRLHAIMDEAVLHRIVGQGALMNAQLESIVEKTRLPNVTVQVIPYEAGSYPALDSSFTILNLPGPTPGIVYVEGLFGFIYLQGQRDIEQFQKVFYEMREIAAGEQESTALITAVSKDLSQKV